MTRSSRPGASAVPSSAHVRVRRRPLVRVHRRLAAVLAGALVTGVALLGPGTQSASSAPSPVPRAYDQTYRPQFHFSPKTNWMNDPNGMIFYRGQYHLFFQHNPTGNVWGNMSWGHAVSKDLVHWTQLPLAISYDGTEAIFSGSAVFDAHNSSGFGTAANPPLVAIYTSAKDNSQSQALAYSTDGGRSFTKYAGNPVLDIGSAEFRDPKVFWYAPAKEWRMVLVLAKEHKVTIYRSKDLKQWTYLSAFGPAGAVGGVWECPDLFPMAIDGNPDHVKWVLVVNLNPGGVAGGSAGQYFVGDFDGTRFTADPGTATTPRWLDYGRDFYAGVTFNDLPRSQRTMIAWMNNWDYANLIPTDPWRSAMSLPRRLRLETRNGRPQLTFAPVNSVRQLRQKRSFQTSDDRLPQGTTTLSGRGASGNTVEIVARFRARDADKFGLKVRVGSGQRTVVGYDVARRGIYLDRRKSGDVDFSPKFASAEFAPLRVSKGMVTLRVLVDRSSVEVFGNGGRATITDQVFPHPRSSRIQVFSSGGRAQLRSLTIWQLTSSWR